MQSIVSTFSRFSRGLLYVSVLALLSACSTMSAEECQVTDWEYLGGLDVMDGKKDLTSRAKSHARACSKQGVAMDTRAYQRGWMLGLKEFCTPQNGKAYAEKGARFQPGYCPPQLEGAFLDGYSPARDRYTAQQDLVALQKKIEEKKREIRTARADKSSSPNHLAYLQSDLRDLQQELLQLQLKLR